LFRTLVFHLVQYHQTGVFAHAWAWLAAESLQEISRKKAHRFWLAQQGGANIFDLDFGGAVLQELLELDTTLAAAERNLVRGRHTDLGSREETYWATCGGLLLHLAATSTKNGWRAPADCFSTAIRLSLGTRALLTKGQRLLVAGGLKVPFGVEIYA
jgi:hypothetical protein